MNMDEPTTSAQQISSGIIGVIGVALEVVCGCYWLATEGQIFVSSDAS